MAAFNGRTIVQPDMIIADERAIPAAPTVIDALGTRGLYMWIYRAAQWYVTIRMRRTRRRKRKPSSFSRRSCPAMTAC